MQGYILSKEPASEKFELKKWHDILSFFWVMLFSMDKVILCIVWHPFSLDGAKTVCSKDIQTTQKLENI